jgi:hypothetical protein
MLECAYTNGVWRSWLARSVRDAEVGGSSPLTPTKQKRTGFLYAFAFIEC